MRRLAIADALTAATAALFVGLLFAVFSPLWTEEAHARPWWISCQTPIVCPGTSGTCTGCVAGAQVGVCSTTWVPTTCAGVPANCAGLDTITGLVCNCSTNAC